MKSKFAKFIDGSVGSCLIFVAAFAVMRYYTTADLSIFCAVTITACVLVLLKFKSNRKADNAKLSAAADDMFFDFMFMQSAAPTKALYGGLKKIEPNTELHGNGVYLNGHAAYCFFDAPPLEKDMARTVSKAKHYGADKITLLCKAPPSVPPPKIEGVAIKCVYGDEVYKLFASLSALPQKKYSIKRRSRFSAFRGAFDKDKILRYILLATALFFVAYVGRSIVPFVFSVIALTLAIISIALNVKRALSKT